MTAHLYGRPATMRDIRRNIGALFSALRHGKHWKGSQVSEAVAKRRREKARRIRQLVKAAKRQRRAAGRAK